MNKIRVMDTSLSNQIAAGEVIERPASVVKELVENSIDAKAKTINVIIKEAGRTLIIVEDDGVGMTKDDAKLAFARHATSKLFSTFDLFRINSLGFRGEALPSISSIANVTLLTSTGDKVGTKIIVNNDKLDVSNAPIRKGTVIEVSQLFYNTPARLKYLKNDYVETAAVVEVVSKLAMAHTDIAFSLTVDDKTKLTTTGRGNLKETIMNIYGVFTASNLIDFNYKTPDYEITGFLGKNEIAKANRYSIITNLNGRNVYMNKVVKAIIEAYSDFIPPSRFPFVVLDLKIEPSLLDVNVHPSKREVRFSKETNLINDLLNEIPKILRQTDLIYNSTSNEDTYVGTPPSINVEKIDLLEIQDNQVAKESFHLSDSVKDSILSINEEFVEPEQAKPSHKIRAVAQLNLTYLVCEDGEGGMFLIDQHAAAERINYENFQKTLNSNYHLKRPLFPLILEYSLSDASLITDEKLMLLKTVGLTIQRFGNSSFRVEEVPLWTDEYDEKIYVTDLIEQVLTTNTIDQKLIRKHAVATFACKASIKANKRLNIYEMQGLIDQLLACDNPYTCPHGRPTIVTFNKYQLEKLFKRTGV